MLHKAKTLKGYKLQSLDGEIGKVKEFYFDDHHWTVRYLVADTGNWLTGRQVLLSPHALAAVATETQHIAVHLTRKQIEESPSLESDKPVSRQYEEAYYAYYEWPMYWSGPFLWGPSPYIGMSHVPASDPSTAGGPVAPKEPSQPAKAWDPHLRSTHDVSGHQIQATDGEIGHVEDFIVDDQTWAIRYLIIGTRNWWPGKKVLVAPQWIQRVSWDEAKVFVNLSRQAIQQSPEYTEQSLLTREYETDLHRHYNRQGYWVDEPAAPKHSR